MEELRILEHFTSNESNEVTFYVNRELEDTDKISVVYGNIEEEVKDIRRISEIKQIYTVILVDNSLSVMGKHGEETKKFLQKIVENKMENEMLLIAEIEESNEAFKAWPKDFSNDTGELNELITSMEIENKDADIFVSMSKAISLLKEIKDDDYKRILILSDGIHESEESVNYSKTEFDEELEKNHFPIYVMGVSNEKNITNDLRNLFFYARKTGGEYAIFQSF